ncbi:MAG: phosphoribosylamine--glycine ligase [Saprospiraceae bacterium]|nr:phosphoribosylamine--glycine ligase [Saprospiraceae bacterium]
MNILLLGSGGREHTFAWKMRQSPLCEKLIIAPGNAGMTDLGININIDPIDFQAVRILAIAEKIDMIVVGPEEPLVRGIYDYFQHDLSVEHIAIVGPSRMGALLEGSKAYAKRFMQEFDIPTAAYREFSKEDLNAGLNYIAQQKLPIVLKADGLAAGKGVIICATITEAQQAFREMLDGKFGEASAKVVIEEFLTGIEFSVFVLTDGKDYKILPVAKDYKRIGEGDTGPNTGGMGAVSHPPFVDQVLMQKVEERVIKRTIKGIQKTDLDYKGFIFFGLINVNGDPYVIEYNCRMGDPETEVVFPRLKTDLVALMQAMCEGRLSEIEIEEDERAAATVILVSGGYPDAYEKGKMITGLEQVEGSIVFHAGTKSMGNQIVSNGGRVLAITSYGKDFHEALQLSYKNAEKIQFNNKYYRKDIGFDL